MIWWLVSVIQREIDSVRALLSFELRLGLVIFDAISLPHHGG